MLGSPEAIVVLVLVLVLFGGAQIPKLARNLGLAQKELKDALRDDEPTTGTPATTSTDDADSSVDA